MKKFLISALCGISLLSCTKDKSEEPFNCNMTVVFDNVAFTSGGMYVTQEYPLEVESVSFSSKDTKYIAKVECGIDERDKSTSAYSPYKIRFDTRNLGIGTHVMYIRFDIVNIYDVNIIDNVQYMFIVVSKTEDLPNGSELGTYTNKFKVTPD